jgi:hypothetical protein
MKPATKLGIGLGVLVVLCFVALALGFTLNSSGQDRPGTPAWANVLGGLSARFAPKLPLARLRCNDQPVASDFRLTETQSLCRIRIPRDGREDYRKADLMIVQTPAAANLGVYIRAEFDDQYFDEDDPDERCRGDGQLAAFRVEILYEPAEDSGGDWDCWLQQERSEPIALTVLRDGGELTLQCQGCENGKEVSMRMQ